MVRYTEELPPTRPARVPVDRARDRGPRSPAMPTAEKIDTVPKPQLSRSDIGAAIVSIAVGVLATLGLLPTTLSAEQAIAIGTGIFTLLAIGRALWERRAELNRSTLLQQARDAASLYRDMLADARARHAADLQRIDAARAIAARAADPNDDTKLSPAAIIDVLATPEQSDVLAALPDAPPLVQGYPRITPASKPAPPAGAR